MRKTSKRRNKKKNKRGGNVSSRESKFLTKLRKNVTQRKTNKERIKRILYMLKIDDDDSDETMRNKVINSNKLFEKLLKSLIQAADENAMLRQTMNRGQYGNIFQKVLTINRVLMSMMDDPRENRTIENRTIENRTFNNLNFVEYRGLIRAAATERGSDDMRDALNQTDVMLLRTNIMELRDTMDTAVATMITSIMPDVLQEIEQNFAN